MIFNTAGISVAYKIGAYLPWRKAMILQAGAMAVIMIAVFVFCPETHVWLLMKNREEEARYVAVTS